MPRNGSGNYSLPTNAWNPAINGVSATPGDWQALINDVAAAIQASVSADGQTPITGNLQMGGHVLTGAGAPSGTGMSLRWEQLTRGADIPSATSITIPPEGQFFAVTGTTAIAGFGATIAGRLVYIKFDAGIVLTNSASFILPGGANITTQADDIAVFLSVSIGVWECVSYPRVQNSAASSDHYGPTAPPVTWSGMTWADSGTNTLWRRNAANDGWADEGILFHRALPQFTSLPTVNKGDIHIDGAGPHTFNPGTSAYAPIIPGRPILVKTYDGLALIKTSANTLSVRAGTYVSVAGQYIPFLADTAITLPGAMTRGEDYSVWVHPDGTAEAIADPYSSPAVAPVPGAIKIGGFHNSLIPAGTTVASEGLNTASVTASGGSMAWTQADLDRIIGINEFSFWDLSFRCAGEQRGMVFEPLYREWWGIYFMSTDGDTNGPSAALSDVASGTVLPFVAEAWGGDGVLKYAALNGWTAHEMVSRFGLHLPLYDRFQAAAFGVTEGISLGGGSVTIPATAHQAKYASRIGLEQATGHACAIGAPTNAVGGPAYAGNGRGSWYGSYGMPLFGGSRGDAANCGSRTANFGNALSNVDWTISVRAAGDHLNLGRTAR